MNASPPAYTAEELRRRARSGLLEDVAAFDWATSVARSDYDLSGAAVPDRAKPARRAAVLVPVRDMAGGASVILTERSQDMPSHAGQISFPGGRLAHDGEPALDAALREAEEEIGLAREQTCVIGFLDTYLTGTGYLIAPVVAVVERDFEPVIEEREVASVFEVPLAFLMDPANHTTHERDVPGSRRRYYAMTFEERFIWGATAAMLKNLYDRVYR